MKAKCHNLMDTPKQNDNRYITTTYSVYTRAVTLHNIPEGMAVGVVYAGFLSGNGEITASGALALSLGSAIQNFPEGGYYLYASAGRGNEERASLSKRCPIRHCRAAGGGVNNSCSTVCRSSFAVFAEFCRRSYDLCGSGRTDS